MSFKQRGLSVHRPLPRAVALLRDLADLDLLPVLTLNEGDAGAYVNAAAMICKERGTGAVNVGIYRHQKQGKRQLGLMVNPANHANYVRAEYEDHNEAMEVALAIGHHPALNMAAVSKQAGVGSELEIAGSFLGEPLQVVKAETVNLMVPARAEIIIEGIVPPKKRHYEGPFGDFFLSEISLAANGQRAGNHGRADGAQTDQQDSEFARSGADFDSFHGELDYIRP